MTTFSTPFQRYGPAVVGDYRNVVHLEIIISVHVAQLSIEDVANCFPQLKQVVHRSSDWVTSGLENPNIHCTGCCILKYQPNNNELLLIHMLHW